MVRQKFFLVETIKERCRGCYTCVRECPAKAIRILDGQASVVAERCIGCGNCVRVCSQGAKRVYDSTVAVNALLKGAEPVAACVAPSFPAEFSDVDYPVLVGILRKLGFAMVCEVGFGADLVARAYRKLLDKEDNRRYIATSCPGIIGYVERYHPDLVPNLAPIVSPMIALARALRRTQGDAFRIVFIGPCIAKKGEAASDEVLGEVDAVLTFKELRDMLDARGIAPEGIAPSNFDPPHAGPGALFPITRGMFQAAEIREDLRAGHVVAADGKNFMEAIKEFESGDLDARLLEALCCEGCIMGAGVSNPAPHFSRRSRVSQYVRRRSAETDARAWRRAMADFADLNLERRFAPNDQRVIVEDEIRIREILAKMGKFEPSDELNCGACGYNTCREHAVAILKGLAENEMCLPYTIEQLRKTVKELGISHEELAMTQHALMQAEKLASMGQLAAGIAHELNNPLGVVLMYAHVLLDEHRADAKLGEDVKLIADQADRCKKIVAGLLNFARQNKLVRQPTNLRTLVEQCLKTIPEQSGVSVRIEQATDDLVAEIDRDHIAQVLTNLVANALAAMPDGGSLTIEITGDADRIGFSVSDTGVGIPRENMGKLFEPFFTTKPIGKGTGLGLAVSYGIVKMHYGDISAESNADPKAGPTGTTFRVSLPRREALNAVRNLENDAGEKRNGADH